MRVSKKNDKYLYAYSSDVHQNVEIRIGSLDGVFRDAFDPTRVPAPMVVEVTVYSHGRSIGCPVSTSFACSTTSRNHIKIWDEWLTLPIKYSDISRDSFLHFTLWDQVDQLNLPTEFSEKCKREKKRVVSSPSILLDDSDEEWDEWEGPASKVHNCPSSSIFPRRLVAECSFSLFCPRGKFRSGVIDLQLEMVDRPNPCRPQYEPWNFGGDADDIDGLIRLATLFIYLNRIN
uniref:C2 PI3K-type domain-containing protein n=1 Tax=Pristionchus pacificus TaxID=54126 RepID=A0A8R1Z9R2_PRIPA